MYIKERNLIKERKVNIRFKSIKKIYDKLYILLYFA